MKVNIFQHLENDRLRSEETQRLRDEVEALKQIAREALGPDGQPSSVVSSHRQFHYEAALMQIAGKAPYSVTLDRQEA